MRRRRIPWGIAVLSLAAVCVIKCGEPVTLGSFNIQFFPMKATKPARVADRIAELNADVFAVQEIRDKTVLERVLALASKATGRSYMVVLGEYCEPEPGKDRWLVGLGLGIVFDANRYRLIETRDHRMLDPDGRNTCRIGYPPALLAVLEDDDGDRLAAMSVHFRCCGGEANLARRREEWRYLADSFARIEGELDAPLVVLGDFNTVGFNDDALGERTYIDGVLDEHDLKLLSTELPCTEYFYRKASGELAVSVLDHALVHEDADGFSEAEVLGMCHELSCKLHEHADFKDVSDHCPIRIRFDD